MKTPGALDGLRVVDFGQYLAAPMAAMILADNGADVIRIDPPGGPRWKHAANAMLQRGKQSLVLDLKSERDNAMARELIASADVLLEGFRPGVMKRLGLGPEAMTTACPELIYCSIPGFGHDDPRAGLAGWEGIVGAAAAYYVKGGNDLIASSGGEASSPIFNPLPVASNYAALVASSSIVAALIARRKGGCGQIIEVPLFDAIFEGVGVLAQALPSAVPNSVVHRALDGVYQCADGLWIYICMPTPEFWSRLSETLMDEGWFARGLHDAHALALDPEKALEAKRYLAAIFLQRPAREWDPLANEALLNFTICKTTSEWLEDDQAKASGTSIAIDDPEFGPTRQFGYTHHLSKTPPAVSHARRPLNGDAEQIPSRWGRPSPHAPAVRNEDVVEQRGLPLLGFKVIDTSHYLAGPTCGRILAEYGAEVIKIDAPERPIVGFLQVNSGKRSALVDLKTPLGRAVLNSHLKDADVLIQSFSPGTVEKLGIDEAGVRDTKQDIIYTSINCYGENGPRSSFHGVEAVGQSITGMAWRWGGDIPKMQRLLVCDYGAGHLAALGTLIALYHRTVTGEGQHVHTSLVQAGTFHQAALAVDYLGKVWDEPSGAGASGWGPLDRLYEASDGWFYLAVPHEDDRGALARVTGLEGIEAVASENLPGWLTPRFALADVATWCVRIREVGLAIHQLEEFQALLNSDLVRERGLVVTREHKGVGDVRGIGATPKLSLTPIHTTLPVAIPPGCSTADIVLESGLGDRLNEMLESGAVAERPPEGTFLWL